MPVSSHPDRERAYHLRTQDRLGHPALGGPPDASAGCGESTGASQPHSGEGRGRGRRRASRGLIPGSAPRKACARARWKRCAGAAFEGCQVAFADRPSFGHIVLPVGRRRLRLRAGPRLCPGSRPGEEPGRHARAWVRAVRNVPDPAHRGRSCLWGRAPGIRQVVGRLCGAERLGRRRARSAAPFATLPTARPRRGRRNRPSSWGCPIATGATAWESPV